MNRVAGRTSRIVAGALMLSMTAYGMPISAAAAPSAGAQASEIVGNVLGPDALTAVPGASVKAAHTTTRKIYASQTTGADGVYKLSDLPPGTYDLAVQTSDGLFPADAVVEVKPGRRTMVSLAIRSDKREDPKPEDPKPEGDKPADPNAPAQPPQGEKPPEPAPQQQKKKGGGFWRSPAGAAVAIVGGAALIGFAANSAASDDEEDTPPLTESGNE